MNSAARDSGAMRKRLCILGATGSVGAATLDVALRHPNRYEIFALTARRRVDGLYKQCCRCTPRYAVVELAADANQLAARLRDAGLKTEVLHGAQALCEVAAHPEADYVMAAIVGAAGLAPCIAAAEAGKRVLLANKEVLVMAGALVQDLIRSHGGSLAPIDSEHSALWQCLVGEGDDPSTVHELILTASGGALRRLPVTELANVTPDQALAHPTWRMGPKVTIDSATLMNKGLEVIEAHWLFDVPFGRIRVLIHPTSVVHSLVQFVDGSVKAQLGITDMRLPIQYALSYPERWPSETLRVDVARLGDLHFEEPDWDRYPCLRLAIDAGRRGGTYPAALCGADEAAVDLFLSGAIRLTAIPDLVDRVLQEHRPTTDPDLAAILDADEWARARCTELAAQ